MLGKAREGQVKRKRQPTRDAPKKRPRSESSDGNDSQAEILHLEKEILESKKNYNNIAILLKLAASQDDASDSSILASVALCRVFVRLLAAGVLINKKGLLEKEAVVVQWLKDMFREYKRVITLMLSLNELASTALVLSMKILKAEGQYLYHHDDYNFPKSFLRDIVLALIKSKNSEAQGEFVTTYVDEYDDVRFFTLQTLK
jgi:U3 small nucleolar RNA-associated protein 19